MTRATDLPHYRPTIDYSESSYGENVLMQILYTLVPFNARTIIIPCSSEKMP